MKCAVCGHAELIHDIRDITLTHNGQEVLIQSVEGDYCPTCGEAFFCPTVSERISNELLYSNKPKESTVNK